MYEPTKQKGVLQMKEIALEICKEPNGWDEYYLQLFNDGEINMDDQGSIEACYVKMVLSPEELRQLAEACNTVAAKLEEK